MRAGSALALLLAAGCSGPPASDTPDAMPPWPTAAEQAAFRAILDTPDGLELPAIPEYNPPTTEKRTLGRRLFYDVRLSFNETTSCASCHQQALAFADGRVRGIGANGQPGRHNSPGLANAAWAATLTWANNGLLTLEDQIPIPIRGDNPVELGVSDAYTAEVLARFDADPELAALFRAAFPDSPSGATTEKIVFALATFVRSLASADSRYDRHQRGDDSALTDQEKRGLSLFSGERLECFHCHRGVNLTVSYHDVHTTAGTAVYPFFNTGLYNVDGKGSLPGSDQGLIDVTHDSADMGRFRPPSLRNVALTAPYMHDGSIATLEEVVRTYAAGGRVITNGPNAGDGRTSPYKSSLIAGFAITDEEVADVVAFLGALTDESFVTNPAFSDPTPPSN